MPEFLNLLPPGDALALLLSQLPSRDPDLERLPVEQAAGRVTARPVRAPEALPGFDRSTVDGYAVRAADTFGASESLPGYLTLAGEVPMGSAPGFTLKAGQAALIHTGGMLPQGTDAVVMLEMTQESRPGELEVLKAVAVGENILRRGEDVAQGSEVLPAGRRLRPAELGGLLALGIMEVEVARRPRLGIISSGDEVVAPHQPVQPGQVRDVNSYTLGALVTRQGGEPQYFGIVPDREDAVEATLRSAMERCDAVVITAGSSASTRDLTAQVIERMGRPGVLVHGVNVRPGKPTILAVCNGKAVIGLPGNPVSALVIAGLFVTPLIERLSGLPGGLPQPSVKAHLTLNLASQAGREDYVPVRLVASAEGWQADPIFYKSNLIFSLARADGLVKIPAAANGLEAGQVVDVLPL